MDRPLFLRGGVRGRIVTVNDSLKQMWQRAPVAMREFFRNDLRWSYALIGGLIVLGVVINIFLPHGWTIWPLFFAAGGMSMVHEAAERNGQGIPPLHVYAFIAAAIFIWVLLAAISSILNPFVMLLGLLALAYQVFKGYLQDRERNRLIEARRADGLCIHCGHPRVENQVFCDACGEEPDPANARLRRVASIVHTRKNTGHMRSVLSKQNPVTGARAREQALIARRRANRPRH